MAMWGLYGKPKTDAICISFSNKTFNELITKNYYLNRMIKKNAMNLKKIAMLMGDIFAIIRLNNGVIFVHRFIVILVTILIIIKINVY